jgi:hypothetical protein
MFGKVIKPPINLVYYLKKRIEMKVDDRRVEIIKNDINTNSFYTWLVNPLPSWSA